MQRFDNKAPKKKQAVCFWMTGGERERGEERMKRSIQQYKTVLVLIFESLLLSTTIQAGTTAKNKTKKTQRGHRIKRNDTGIPINFVF